MPLVGHAMQLQQYSRSPMLTIQVSTNLVRMVR